MSYKLSICIPTYNRLSYLRETLDAILMQAPLDGVEITVSDNASDDGTAEAITDYQVRFTNLKYYRWPRNVGPDLNFMKAVELASGEYCWLMSSDDKPVEGALHKMLSRITADKHEICVYYANRIECNTRMRPYGTTRWLENMKADRVYDFNRREDVLDYFRDGRGIGSLFSYLSALVFKREAWAQVPFRPVWDGTIYGHVFKIMAMLKAGGKLAYLFEPLVYNRNGNDTFMAEGALRRFRYDLDAYVLAANETYGDDSELRREFLRVAARSIWELAVKMRILAHDSKEWPMIDLKLIECGFTNQQITFWKWLGTAHLVTALPFMVLSAIRKLRGIG